MPFLILSGTMLKTAFSFHYELYFITQKLLTVTLIIGKFNQCLHMTQNNFLMDDLLTLNKSRFSFALQEMLEAGKCTPFPFTEQRNDFWIPYRVIHDCIRSPLVRKPKDADILLLCFPLK